MYDAVNVTRIEGHPTTGNYIKLLNCLHFFIKLRLLLIYDSTGYRHASAEMKHAFIGQMRLG